MKLLKNLSQIKLKLDLKNLDDLFNKNWKFLLKTLIVFFIITGLSALAIFFAVVQSPEQVLVPEVVGKDLTVALQEMQVKELYPKIQLRYSETSEEKGLVLEQSPSAGAIVKAGRRINLVVSQGAILDRVGDYVGLQVEDLRAQLQTLFAASSNPMIRIPDVIMFQPDESEPGTILEQNPPANTNISRPITLELVVSSGLDDDTARIPNIAGLSLNDALLQLSRNKVIFMFTPQAMTDGQEPGTIVSQTWPSGGEESVPIYTRVNSIIALPSEPVDGIVYGLVQEVLPQYPYALELNLVASPPDGDDYSIVTLFHTGRELTIPYAVPQGTRLTLMAQENEVLNFIVQ